MVVALTNREIFYSSSFLGVSSLIWLSLATNVIAIGKFATGINDTSSTGSKFSAGWLILMASATGIVDTANLPPVSLYTSGAP